MTSERETTTVPATSRAPAGTAFGCYPATPGTGRDLLYYSGGASSDFVMYSIGQRLREERLRKGIKLTDIAEQTRIRLTFLEAIEEDRFEVFPGRFFARSFVRQYARQLELEDPELEVEIMRQLGEPASQAGVARLLAEIAEARPEKPSVRWRIHPAGRTVAYATAGMLAVAALFGLYWGWRQNRVLAEGERPAIAETLGEAPGAQPSVAEAPPAAEPTPSAVPAAAPAPVKPAASPLLSASAEAAAALVAEVGAARDCWIQVIADGKVLFSNTLQPGESRSFRASQVIRILTGNAGALDIRRNGQPLGPIGPEGQIRTIELTLEGHTITAPTPRTTSPESTEPAPDSPPL